MDYGGRALPRAGAAGPPRQEGAESEEEEEEREGFNPEGNRRASCQRQASCHGGQASRDESPPVPTICCSPGQAGSERDIAEKVPRNAVAHLSFPPLGVAVPSLLGHCSKG